MKWISALLVMAACGGSKPVPSKAASDRAMDAATVDVLTAVALHELKDVDPQKPVCLAIRGVGPEEVLPAIKAKYPNTVVDSACHGGGPDGSSVQAPDGPGVRIDIGPVTVTNGDTASCNGGGAYVSGGAREIQYIVEHHGSTWSVTNEKVLSEM
ncbi:MAG TPA: hypothetical protein VGM90_06650 [Kofleriaceae bacterium]|jgi:hypothetical protein